MIGMAQPKHALTKLRNRWQDAGRWQTTLLVAAIVMIAGGLAAYTAAASYETVSHLAARYNVALPQLNPLGIDGGVAGLIIFDIALTWIGEPIWWLRMCVRLFACGMIGANAAAGWPSPVGTGLRVGAPVLFVIITEVARTWLLRRKHADERARKAAERKQRRDNRIPRVRWLLDRKGTYELWKRMRLWKEPSYARAVSMELARMNAIEKLGMKYGEDWRSHAPKNLVWMLDSGVRMTEALAAVKDLTGPERTALEAALETEKAAREAAETALVTAQQEAAEALTRAEEAETKLAAERNKTPRKKAPPNAQDDDVTTELRAYMELKADPDLLKPRKGGELARRLGVSGPTGRRLHGRLVVNGRLAEPPGERSPENPDARSGERS
jgi:hypothetical protein